MPEPNTEREGEKLVQLLWTLFMGGPFVRAPLLVMCLVIKLSSEQRRLASLLASTPPPSLLQLSSHSLPVRVYFKIEGCVAEGELRWIGRLSTSERLNDL